MLAASVGDGDRMKFSVRALTTTSALLVALLCSPAVAQQPPEAGCVAVSESEYNTAVRRMQVSNRFGNYARTGTLWRRFYWYCRIGEPTLPTNRIE